MSCILFPFVFWFFFYFIYQVCLSCCFRSVSELWVVTSPIHHSEPVSSPRSSETPLLGKTHAHAWSVLCFHKQSLAMLSHLFHRLINLNDIFCFFLQIATISPGMTSCENTLNTLRYANRWGWDNPLQWFGQYLLATGTSWIIHLYEILALLDSSVMSSGFYRIWN